MSDFNEMNYRQRHGAMVTWDGFCESGIPADKRKILGSSELHYFWASGLLLRAYFIICFSVAMRQPFLLHGITILILVQILGIVTDWWLFLMNSREARSSGQHIRWMLTFASGEIEKALEGDAVRKWLAGFSFNVWNSKGKSFINSFLRNQSEAIHEGLIQEARERLILHNKRSDTI